MGKFSCNTGYNKTRKVKALKVEKVLEIKRGKLK
jgi:hypothetical protein